MEDSRIDDLIRELRSLQLQAAQLQAATQHRVQEADEHQREDAQAVPHDLPRHANGFCIGDRVRILNKIKKPATWNNTRQWLEVEARTAVVTLVCAEQVFFTTDNGVKTWRAPNNLRRL
jgi:hypothetical protein